MSYVPNFNHDIFISYVCVDDISLIPSKQGWVTAFVKNLKVCLDQELERSGACSLWIDSELSYRKKLSPQIFEAIKETETILIMLSPGYLKSDWCRRERDTFLNWISKRSDSRVILVERNRIEDNNRLPEFNDLKGFRFWKLNDAGCNISEMEVASYCYSKFRLTDQTIHKRVLINLLEFALPKGMTLWFSHNVLPIIDQKLRIHNFCGILMIRIYRHN